jgi:hypothetical protein
MNKQTQKGNAIIWILIAVGLFAALGYAFSSTSRNSTATLTGEEAKSHANQIISLGNEVKSAVKRLQLRGCDETEISFENNIVAGYTNANSPTNKKCHVYDPAGGGLSYNSINESLLDSSQSAQGYYTQSVFFGGLRVVGLNTSQTELMMYIPFVKQSVCSAINQSLGLGSTVGTDTFGGGGGGGNFNGESSDYDPFATPDLGDELTSIQGQGNFCIEYGGTYHYFTALIAR